VKLQGSVPEHGAEFQPAKADPVPGVAISVMAVPLSKIALHVGPQLIPEGILTTDPVPEPAGLIVNVD